MLQHDFYTQMCQSINNEHINIKIRNDSNQNKQQYQYQYQHQKHLKHRTQKPILHFLNFLKRVLRNKVVGTFLTTAVQLDFIQCPFPNQIQFGLEKLQPKIAYNFPNQFQFGLERKKLILQDTDSKAKSDWFGKF